MDILEVREMSCHGLCHICGCKEDILLDSVRVLKSIVKGVEAYEERLNPNGVKILHQIIDSLPEAREVLVRARQCR